MSRQANKTVIGIFIVGAITLTVIGIMVFGSGKFFSQTIKYALYFEGSVKGLNIGAPVMFRGVKIGSVTDILMRFDPSDMSVHIPVIIEFEPERITRVSGERAPRKYVKSLIDRGLRAQLELQSMVTGQLMVNFDFFPDKPARYMGIESEYPEIPTVQSGFEELTRTIETLPLDELFSKLVNAVEGIDKLVNSPEITGSFSSLRNTLDSADRLLSDINRHVDPLLTRIGDASDAARGAFVQAEKSLAMKDGATGELASELKGTLASARLAMEQAEKTLTSIESSTSGDSRLAYELNAMLQELSAAARSVRYLADYLEQHPEALFRGKGK